MVNLVCQLTGCRVLRLNMTLCVSVMVFLDEISIWIGGLIKSALQCGWAYLILLRAWIKQKVEGRTKLPSFTFWLIELGHPYLFPGWVASTWLLWSSGPWTWTITSQLSGSPVCRWLSEDFLSLQNHTQPITYNVSFLYMYISVYIYIPIVCFSGGSWLTQPALYYDY